MAEDYVRPATVAFDPPGPRAAAWRFRAAMILLLALVIVAVVLVARAVINNGEGDPNVGTLAPPSASPAAPRSA